MTRLLVPLIILATAPGPGRCEPPGAAGLFINEIGAIGEGRDWVELYNGSGKTIDCLPVLLRDRLGGGGNEWPLCIGNLRSGERRIVTCPNFLNGNGEELGLFDGEGNLLDQIVYDRQMVNLTYGRRFDGAGEWCFQYPTERDPNGTIPPGSPPIIIGAPYHWPVKPGEGEPVLVSAAVVAAAGLADVQLLVSTDPAGDEWWPVDCRDDGSEPDRTALDGRFTGGIPGQIADTVLRYRIRARDRRGEETFAPSPEEWFSIRTGYSPPPIRINEIQALNLDVGRYAHGGKFYLSDWIELYNTGPDPIDVSNWYLSDRRSTTVPFPLLGEGSKVVPPGGHLLVWAKRGFPGDAPEAVGVNFSLSRNGEEVVLFHEDGFSVVDAVEYPPLAADTSYGRIPEGTGEFSVLETPTPRGGIVHPPRRVEVLSYEPLLPELGEPVTVRVWISPEVSLQTAQVYNWLMEESWVPLFDDGTHGDDAAGDDIFTCRIGPFHDSGILHFAIEVTDGDGAEYRDPELAEDWYRFPLSWESLGSLRINEVFSGSHLCSCGCPAFQSLTGPLEPRNFVEIRNTGPIPENLKNLWLTDDPLEYEKVLLVPDEEDLEELEPGGICLMWFYGGDEQRILHPQGGTVFLSKKDKILDAIPYGEAIPGRSHGYLPQEGGTWTLLEEPSPGAPNGSTYFLRADVNGDLHVNLGDPIRAIHVLLGAQSASCRDAMDIDDSGQLDITDPIYLLSYLFLGDAPPPHPFPDLGTDPTADDLDCQGE